MSKLLTVTSMSSSGLEKGLHHPEFATLANAGVIQGLPDGWQNTQGLIRLDIRSELKAMPESDLSLAVKVPTLGFSDPVFDFDMRPWFATPLAVNGMGATEDAQASKPAQLFGVDFMGNQYPLLLDANGFIDYQAIAQTMGEQSVYTTLEAVIYVYSQEQLVQGKDLQRLGIDDLEGSMIFLPPTLVPEGFEITLGWFGEDFTPIRTEHVDVFQGSDGYFVNDITLSHQQGEGQGELNLVMDAQVQPYRLPGQTQVRLELDANGIEGMPVKEGKILVEQSLGLTHQTTVKVLTALVPFHELAKSLAQTAPKQGLNDFSDPMVVESFYGKVIEGLANTSIPLMAMQPNFNDDDSLFEWAQNLDWNEIPQSDAQILSGWIEGHADSLSFELSDAMDEMLSVEQFYPQTHLNLTTNSEFQFSDFSLQLDLQAENFTIQSQWTANADGFESMQSLSNLMDMNSLDFPDTSMESLREQSSQFEISEHTLLKGADVIEGFDWGNHDTVNLGPLLEKLGPDSHQVRVERVDSEAHVFVDKVDEFGQASEQMHVATIPNAPSDGNLDLSQFIELG